MSIFEFRATTPGEHLLHFINEQVLKSDGFLPSSESLGLGATIGRGRMLHEYAIAVNSLNLTARLIKKAERVIELDDAALHHGEFVKFLQQTFGLVKYEDGVVDELARQSIYAAKMSKRAVSKATKRKVRGDKIEVECYLCGNMCVHKSEDPRTSIYYEHIWPASYGGDSIEQNLLPACFGCNDAKEDMLLWQTGAIFSFVLKPNPSIEERKSIGRREKIARRMQDILLHANTNNCTLKEAAIEMGPAKFDSLTAIDNDDAVDYFNLHFN